MSGIFKKLKKSSRALCALAAVGVMAGGTAFAQQDNWNLYISESGAFQVLFPQTNDENAVPFRINEKGMVYSSELSAVMDSRPYKDAVKRYIVRIDQTFGKPIDAYEAEYILDREVESYIAHYNSIGGTVQDRLTGVFNGHPGREILINFEDPDLGPQALRAIFMVSDLTKIQQVVIGPDETMYAYRTKDFLGSIKIENGYASSKGDFAANWKAHVSKQHIFTVLLPEVAAPFVLNEPTNITDVKTDVVSLDFFDPARGERLFYNVYGYRFDTNITYSEAQQVLVRNHIMKHKGATKGLSYTKDRVGESATLETAVGMKPPDNYPYLNYLRVKAHFLGNYVVVQEVIASYPNGDSDFVNNMLKVIEFHPRRAHDLLTNPAAAAEAAAAEEETAAPAETEEAPAQP